MIDIKNLWIGDPVMIIKSGKTGKFAGINDDGRARINVDGKILLVSASNLDLMPEPDSFPLHALMESILHDDIQVVPFTANLHTEIDLHIEVLAPHKVNELPVRILDFQILQCEKFMDYAIEKKLPRVHIIHGKGEGVLKTAVEHLLKKYKEVRFTFSINDGGGVEVWL
ncbi:MAG: Smr/MutS family protein [Saprospiraceae bacterium]|nr:Smr/MutS family protein [Saprospiraceae bacterium]